MSIPLFKPTIKRKDMDSVLTCLVSDQIGPSSLIDDLLSRVSESLETAGGWALREFPRALSLLLDMLELKEGDRVIISPLAPGAYHKVFVERGIIPLYPDVSEINGTLSPESVEKLLDEGPRALFAVHAMGFTDPLDELSRFDIPLIEDCSCALGSDAGEVKAGTRGDFVLLGMEFNHIITCGGGTLLLVRDVEARSRLDELAGELCSESLLPDMNASLALVQWAQLPGFLEKRRQLAELFTRSSSRGRHAPLKPSEGENPSWYGFPLCLKDSMKEIRQYARKKGIDTALAFSGCCLDYMDDKSACPAAVRLVSGTLLFPLYPMMGQKNGELIGRVLTTLP